MGQQFLNVSHEYRNSIPQCQEFLSLLSLDFLYDSAMKDLQTTIAEWIRAARKEAGLSQDALGAQLALQLGDDRGFSKANISHWETCKHAPNIRQLMAIAKITGRPLPSEIVDSSTADADEDSGKMLYPGGRSVHSTMDADGGFARIPIVDIRVSAGVTGFVAEPILGSERNIVVSAEWLAKHRFNPADLLGGTVTGRSMETSLWEGDRFVVHLRHNRPVSGKVFLVNFDGEACLKRLLQQRGSWYLTSDNPEFPPKNMRDGHAIIVGEVVLKESDRI
jgi:transcriptional regulator with XRE-family HTH domain